MTVPGLLARARRLRAALQSALREALRAMRASARPLQRPWILPTAAAAVLCGLVVPILSAGLARAVLFSPPPTPIIEDREGNFLTEGAGLYPAFGYWDVEGPLNERIVSCLVAAEDRRFYRHPGVDLASLARSVLNNARGGARQGGSTIAMQVARLEYPSRRRALSKAVEMATAVSLVLRYGHEAVMRHYLKIVPQGNQVFGVAYSARRFFHKPLSDVSLAQAALLAALPREPGRMNVFTWAGFEKARDRARLILSLLARRGQVTPDDESAALRELEVMPIPLRESRPSNSYHYALRVLAEEKARGRGTYARPLAASLDPGVQELVSTVAAEALGENRRLDAHGISIIVAERATGEVLGYVGSGSYFDEESAGSIDYARVPRSSGSSLKPFLFALGLDTGAFTPASVLPDLPFFVLSPRGEYHAVNFDDSYLGPMLYRRALANSRNVPALRVLEGVGMDHFLDLARRMGLARDAAKDSEYYGYGLAIGGLYVTLSDLVAAYGTLANDGLEFRLRFFHDGPGARGGAKDSPPRRIFSSYAAREIGLFLSDDTARLPSFPRMSVLEFPFPVAIKTGTSQGFRDAWTVAYTSRFIVGVWMGNPDNHPMNRVAGIVSAVYASRILKGLQPRQDEGIDAPPFPVPEATEAVTVCAISGQVAGPDCPSTLVEHFIPSEAPRETCTVHRRIAVDARDGSPARADTPPTRVVLRPSTVLPAIYAVWGSHRGLGEPFIDAPAPAQGSLSITYPVDGARFLLDPDTPRRFQTLPLEASVQPRPRWVEWYADGRLVARSGFPFAARFPLQPGDHRLQLLVPATGERSPTVTIHVR